MFFSNNDGCYVASIKDNFSILFSGCLLLIYKEQIFLFLFRQDQIFISPRQRLNSFDIRKVLLFISSQKITIFISNVYVFLPRKWENVIYHQSTTVSYIFNVNFSFDIYAQTTATLIYLSRQRFFFHPD